MQAPKPRPPPPRCCQVRDLLSSMWAQDPAARPSATAVVQRLSALHNNRRVLQALTPRGLLGHNQSECCRIA